MQTAFEVVAIISDKDLLNRFHRPADYARDHGERCYSVVFPDDAQGGYGTIGIPWSVAARTRADAVSYAYEYGIRFLNGARPMDVRWSKDLTEVEGSSKVTSVALKDIDPEYKKDYNWGYNYAKRDTGSLDYLDGANKGDAAYDGYSDYAVGREKWHTPLCEDGCEGTGWAHPKRRP